MIEIGINNVVKNFGFKNVLNNASLEIMTGDRAAIVGRNGTGKSTILKIIAGEENAEKGTVSIRKGSSIGMLSQIPKLYKGDTTTREVLKEPFSELYKIEKSMNRLEAEMADGENAENLEALMEEYAGEQDKYISLGGYEMEENFNRIVMGFNLSDMLERPYNVLSGGQKTIVNLASVILRQPDILLLDEPTNHLDIKTLQWFEGYLAKYRGTVVIVSHDRYFLDRVATKTIILEAGACTVFSGNYSFSIKEQERLMLIEFEQYKNQQKKIAAMKAAIKRFREWGLQADNPKFFRKAKELEKRLEKMEVLDRPVLEKPKIPISFAGERTGKEVLKLEDFSLAFGEVELFKSAELLVCERERVCLLGDNGTGKTSLVKIILGSDDEHNGKVQISPAAKIGYIPQEIRFEDEKMTVLDALRSEYPSMEGEARNILAKYFFIGENVFKRVSSLSGGEKVLLKLAILMQSEINFLVLDEPTNHIDIETREMLEDALLDFTGTLLFISHDRYFIKKIAERITVIENRKISSYYGGYDRYIELIS